MDQFLREIHTSVFKQWLLYYHKDNYEVSLTNEYGEDIIRIENDYSLATITFHDQCILELSVTNKITQNVDFYLHFRFETLHHTLSLFNELIEAMEHVSQKKTLQVLLSCSSGLTTGMFAEMLTQAAETLSLDYHVDAVSYMELEKVGNDYDMILLAPQISFQEAKLQAIFHHIPVSTIPSQIFAKYDVNGALELIKNTITQKTSIALNEELDPYKLRGSIDYNDKILVVGITKSSRHFSINYRVYLHEDILMNNRIVKNTFAMSDVNDIINVVLLQHPDLKHVGIACSGITKGGVIHKYNFDGGSFSPRGTYPEYHIVDYLKKLHPQLSFSLDNNSNAIVAGINGITNGKYNSIVFYFLPRGYWHGGMGITTNNQLLKGSHNIAGEIRYLSSSTPPENFEDIVYSEEGNNYLIARMFASSISFLDPDLLVFYNSYAQDIDAIKEIIKDYVPEEYIPEIKKINCIEEYILYGEMVLCIMRLEREKLGI